MGPAPDQTKAFEALVAQFNELTTGLPAPKEKTKPVEMGKVVPLLMQMLQIAVSSYVK